MNRSELVSKPRLANDFAFRKTMEQTTMLKFRYGRGRRVWTLLAVIAISTSIGGTSGADEAKQDKTKTSAGGAQKVSFDKQIRPIIQSHCQGCHQPAKAGGGYVMTSFDFMLRGGDSDDKAIVPSQPGESHMLEMIKPENGKAEMPKGKPPLSSGEIELITRWIAQGAQNDLPQKSKSQYDMAHPPEYTRLPMIPALAFSPGGELLAVAGFHEVILWKADGSESVARLVGLSERIESLAFSPDGKRLAVTGGLPATMGEVQVWDVAKRKLTLSAPVSFDTVYGASWSPDGTKIAFGCTDNSVRAIDAKTGEQVLFMGSHNDWVLDTVFSTDGSHLMSVGRDMAAKLTDVANQRFVDNITSITPGALKGGLAAIARHPKRDEIVIGGSDGEPKLYRAFRQSVRVIGDDSNMIRQFPALPGASTALQSVMTGSALLRAAAWTASVKSVFTHTSSTRPFRRRSRRSRRRWQAAAHLQKPPSLTSITRMESSRSPA